MTNKTMSDEQQRFEAWAASKYMDLTMDADYTYYKDNNTYQARKGWNAAQAQHTPDAAPAQFKDAVFQASIDFIGELTGMRPPDIEVAPPEVFAPFRAFTEKIVALHATALTAAVQQDRESALEEAYQAAKAVVYDESVALAEEGEKILTAIRALKLKDAQPAPEVREGCHHQAASPDAGYLDLMCTDGYLSDMDRDGDDPSVARMPCPKCNADEHKAWVREENEEDDISQPVAVAQPQGDLPPLPDCAMQMGSQFEGKPREYYTPKQMRDYARAALAGQQGTQGADKHE